MPHSDLQARILEKLTEERARLSGPELTEEILSILLGLDLETLREHLKSLNLPPIRQRSL